MKDRYEIIPYRAEHKKDVVELQKHLWSPRPDLNEAYFEWKYERNPYLASPLLYLVRCDGNIVGMRGMLGAKWEAGTPPKPFPGICTEDSVIAPEHRHRKISTEIMKTAFEDLANRGYQYIYSLSAAPITLMASLAMGWKSVGPFQDQCLRSGKAGRFRAVRRRVREMRFFWRYENRLPLRRWVEKRKPLHELGDVPGSGRRRGLSRITIGKTPRPEDMAALVANLAYDGRIRHVRDREYFAWRFLNPLHRYLFLFRGEERLEGYLVLQEYISEFRNRAQVNIVDWEGTSPSVRADLLHAALDLCSFPELHIYTATLDGESKNLLWDKGFRPAQEGEGPGYIPPSILVRSVRGASSPADWALDGRRLLDMANWDLRMVFSMNG